jgi:general secretion pathway protein A
MYTSFYKLKAKPFQISADPDFMWLGEKHQEALATLKYGVLDNKGFLLLTGDVGTGKTTLINTLIQSLSDDILCASVSDPGLSKLDFFNFIAFSFGINQEFLTKGSFLIGFRKFLLDAYDKNKKVLLIIDESQLLTQKLLEEIRLLSNIDQY